MNMIVTEKNDDDTDESASDDGSDCDMEESAFQIDTPEVVEEEDGDVFGNDWCWDQWDEIGDNDEVEGPKEHDHYDGKYGLKDGVGESFHTILQCIFKTTAMNREFFKRLASQSNKYARQQMNTRNTSLFLGHKWENIRVGEMVRFFGIMLRISMEPRKMGGYASYFQDPPVIRLGVSYSVRLTGFDPWAREIMTLLRFKQIRSAFHPEAGRSELTGDKCHQLRYFIRTFNERARHIFHLGPNASFDEGGVPMRSRYCPVRMYNKDKPDKFRVDFFILADSKHYFIFHLDVYQGKNKANIDIAPMVATLPTTQKAVANAIIKSRIDNDVDGCRYIFMDNRYAAPQLLALMSKEWNIRGVGTCKANRKGFPTKELALSDASDRGSFVRLVDKRLGMVATRWKDSRILQTVSTVMKSGIDEVARRIGSEVIKVSCPNDIIQYQKNMGGVDRGDQHRVMGAGFANVAHFKKWYKKAFMGIADFSFLQAFAAWNLSVDGMNNKRGGEVKREMLVKWQFYAAAAEEFMTYLDNDEVSFHKTILDPTMNTHPA